MTENNKEEIQNLEIGHKIPEELAILPMRDVVIFPHMVVPLMVGRDSSIRLINDSLVNDKIIGVVTQKDPELEDPGGDDFFKMGTAVMILKMLKMPDDTIRLMVQGIRRINIIGFNQTKPYFKANVEIIEESVPKSVEIDALVMNIKGLLKKVIELATHLPYDLGVMTINVDEPGRLADLIPAFLSISTEEKQQILQTIDVKKRLEMVTKYMNKELQLLEIGNKIQSQVREEMDKSQREYILREQLKALQKELGEGDEKTIEIQELKERIIKAKMPAEVQKVAEKELDRLGKRPVAASEYTVSRTYLDWLVELPWSINTEDNLDIKSAEKVLDEDHFDLEKVKKRILEFLAVRKLKRDIKGPILCFVEPPGVGKTSLGRSLARALTRKL